MGYWWRVARRAACEAAKDAKLDTAANAVIALAAQGVASGILWLVLGQLTDATLWTRILAAAVPFLTFPVAFLIRLSTVPAAMDRDLKAKIAASEEASGPKFAPLIEVAARAYDRTSQSSLAAMADFGGRENALRFYGDIIRRHFTLFGTMPGTTWVQEIKDTGLHVKMFDNQIFLVEAHHRNEPVWTNLQVRDSDIPIILTHLEDEGRQWDEGGIPPDAPT